MRKQIYLLGFLTLFLTVCHAQDIPPNLANPELIEAAIIEFDGQDGLGSKFAVYSLIVGIYALYWLKQKA